MISTRIKTLASFVEKDDVVLDIGTDHGYLCIYLKENNLCQEVLASDINKNALMSAQNNFQKRNLDIKCYLSDGFNNIDSYYNTSVIAGMGTSTILNIIKSDKCPSKLIIDSHNELPKLRLNLNKLGFKIVQEKVVLEKNHYYVIMLVLKGKQQLTETEILFGISNNLAYYKYLLAKNKELINVVPEEKKKELIYQNEILTGLIEKK